MGTEDILFRCKTNGLDKFVREGLRMVLEEFTMVLDGEMIDIQSENGNDSSDRLYSLNSCGLVGIGDDAS